LDQQLKQETGIDIGLVKVPLLRLAFSEQDVTALQAMLAWQQLFLEGLEWLNGESARKIEPLLSPKVQGALLSPYEYNVSASQLTRAYARGAVLRGAHVFPRRSVDRLLLQGQRVVGIETDQGQMLAKHTVLAAGAWTARWHKETTSPVIIPVKG